MRSTLGDLTTGHCPEVFVRTVHGLVGNVLLWMVEWWQFASYFTLALKVGDNLGSASGRRAGCMVKLWGLRFAVWMRQLK
jgi:hypothetical protein